MPPRAINEESLKFRYTIRAGLLRDPVGDIIIVTANNRADALFRAGMIYARKHPKTNPDKVMFRIVLTVSSG